MFRRGILKGVFIGVCILAGSVKPSEGQLISKTFELRYTSTDVDANGETDFKGETSVLTTEQRVEFLKNYADVSKTFFNDPQLNTKVVTDKEARIQASKIKPQPTPETRKRIELVNWKKLGYKQGQHKNAVLELEYWNQHKNVKVESGALCFTQKGEINIDFPMQAWRSSLEWDVWVPQEFTLTEFQFSDRGVNLATTIGFNRDGTVYYYTGDNTKVTSVINTPSQWMKFKVEFDMAAWKETKDIIRFNLYINDELVADYVPMQRVVNEGVYPDKNFCSLAGITQMKIKGGAGVKIDNLYGLGYQYTGREKFPYVPLTFLDEDFDAKPQVEGWTCSDYNDSLWEQDQLPIVHGGERFAQEDLYLRTNIVVGDYTKAYINLETLDPGGELWINGQVVAVITNRHPQKIEVSRFLKKNSENLLAVKVNHFYLSPSDGEIMDHSILDFNIGWFAGRMSLDLVADKQIEDAFFFTKSLGNEKAEMEVRLTISNQNWLSFRGMVEISLTEWYPTESNQPSFTTSLPVVVSNGEVEFEHHFTIDNPRLWTPATPNLYKVHVVLKDEAGKAVDDFVTTVGVRTISQQGGSFRLNGEVAMLNGAQIMGFRGPIEKIATWGRCAPEYWVAKELMMVQRMNGNFLRMHTHHWEFPAQGINDPRYAEMADQMGVMLLWTTPSWIRTGRGWGQIDFEGFPEYIKQVYNHPSIVVWEAANHTQSFKKTDLLETNLFCEKVYNTIYPVDPSRLISFNSSNKEMHYGNDLGTIDEAGNPIVPAPEWTAPMVTRGNQDAPTGYGKDWSELRNFPDTYYKQNCLDSKDRAYFNFEHQESAAQPNWNLVKGKPWYKLQSYEWAYDEGSIGRKLSVDEWQESQAWQAFSAWEAMKKLRILDYDGFSWCCLHGGANSVTYKKPIIDFLDHAKLAFWTNKMVFQNTVGGSNNVDVVLGPDDQLKPVIIHLGEAMTVDMKVEVKDLQGKLLQTLKYADIQLEKGRNTKELDGFKPKVNNNYFVVEYTISKH